MVFVLYLSILIQQGKMNRIVLIGNGFDLAHNLKTSYRDFIDDLWEGFLKSASYEEPLDNEYLKLEPRDYSEKSLYEMGCQTYDSLLTLQGRADVHLNFKNKFFELISSQRKYQNWVDIENEYYILLFKIIEFSKNKKNKSYEKIGLHSYKIDNLNKDFEQIKNTLLEYLKKVSEEPVELIPAISKHIFSPFNPRDFARSTGDNSRLDNTLFLNFNYTQTINNYLEDGAGQWIKTEVNWIHGNLEKTKDNPIIFGYGDEVHENYSVIENHNDNKYLKNVKSINYLETDNYKNLLKYIESDPYQIFIMGHSCGISDRTLLNTIFEHDNCCSIKVFYHQKTKDEDNFTDIVQNISRNFTDKKRMRDVVVNKNYCEPLVAVDETVSAS